MEGVDFVVTHLAAWQTECFHIGIYQSLCFFGYETMGYAQGRNVFHRTSRILEMSSLRIPICVESVNNLDSKFSETLYLIFKKDILFQYSDIVCVET